MVDTKPEPLLTYEGYRVAEQLIRDINAEHTGYSIFQKSAIRQGTLYPLLRRWVEAGWLTIRDETPQEQAARSGRKGKRRKLIRVTNLGKEKIPAYWQRWQERTGE